MKFVTKILKQILISYVTAQQQSVRYIMVDMPRLRANSTNTKDAKQ